MRQEAKIEKFLEVCERDISLTDFGYPSPKWAVEYALRQIDAKLSVLSGAESDSLVRTIQENLLEQRDFLRSFIDD